MASDAAPGPVLVHPGYHKTATTWLQRVVFKPAQGFDTVLDQDETFAGVIRPHGLLFDPSGPSRTVARRRTAAAAAGHVGVVSLEGLSGDPYRGGRESDAYARRLREILPEARILLTIREQHRIIASVYMQYVLRGGTEPAEQFFRGNPVEGFHGFDPLHFEYDRLVGLYQELFGAENVLVLPLEEIQASQRDAVARITAFAGARPQAPWIDQPATGVSYPEAAVPLLRRANHLRPAPLNRAPALNLGRLGTLVFRSAGAGMRRAKRRDRPVSDFVRHHFAGRFADSNRRLAAMLVYPADLSAYDGFAPGVETASIRG